MIWPVTKDVYGGAAYALMADDGGNVDDAAVSLRLHDAHLVLQAQQRAEHVGLESHGVIFGGLVHDRTGSAFDARVVDRDVDPSEAADGFVDQAAHLLLAADVGLDSFDSLSLRFASNGHCDTRAFLGEGESGGSADAGQSAGN
jgi:hypothetical protein